MEIENLLYHYLLEIGISEDSAKYLNMVILLSATIIVAFLVHYIIRRILLSIFTQLSSKTKSNFDDLLLKNKAPRNIAHIIPLVVTLKLIPFVFKDFPNFFVI